MRKSLFTPGAHLSTISDVDDGIAIFKVKFAVEDD
jgi:hypothetical protein